MKRYEDYRSSITQALAGDLRICQLLAGASGAAAAEPLNRQIFAYDHVPNESDSAGAYITLLLTTPAAASRRVRTMHLTFRVFTAVSGMWVTENGKQALLSDLIVERIDELFNGSAAFGTKLRFVSRKDGYRPAAGYWGAELTYSARCLAGL